MIIPRLFTSPHDTTAAILLMCQNTSISPDALWPNGRTGAG